MIVCFQKLEENCDIFQDKNYRFEDGKHIYSFINRNLTKVYNLILQDSNQNKYPNAYKIINREYDRYMLRLFKKLDRLDIRKQRELIYKICDNNNIDVDINRETLNHISYKEFVAKLSFLKANNCDIMNSEGYLNNIFNISNKHLKVFYDIYINELVYEYFDVKTHRKVR